MDSPEHRASTHAHQQDALGDLMEQSGGIDDDAESVLSQLRIARKAVAARRRSAPRPQSAESPAEDRKGP